MHTDVSENPGVNPAILSSLTCRMSLAQDHSASSRALSTRSSREVAATWVHLRLLHLNRSKSLHSNLFLHSMVGWLIVVRITNPRWTIWLPLLESRYHTMTRGSTSKPRRQVRYEQVYRHKYAQVPFQLRTTLSTVKSRLQRDFDLRVFPPCAGFVKPKWL